MDRFPLPHAIDGEEIVGIRPGSREQSMTQAAPRRCCTGTVSVELFGRSRPEIQ